MGQSAPNVRPDLELRQPPAIAVVGSCNVDLVAYVDRAPAAGETVLGQRFETGFGGKGANQAVMAARLGAEVWMIGALGDDLYAETTLRNFAEQGVDTGGVARVAGSSGVAPIWVEADGSNRIIVVPGANGLVDAAEVAAAVEALSRVDVALGQLEIPQAATAAGLAAARARGAVTILNPAPAAPLDDALLAVTDWLVPNEGELLALARLAGVGPGTNPEAAPPEAATPDSDQLFAEVADRLSVRLVVTLGPAGAALVLDGTVTRSPAPEVDAVDTTGAGDAFVGAFAVGLGLGFDPASAVRLGVACASDSVTRRGTQASFPDRRRAAELRAWMAAGGR
jgi:ribokinase